MKKKDALFTLVALITPCLAQGESFTIPLLQDARPVETPILMAPVVDFQRVFDLASKCGPTSSIWDAANVRFEANYKALSETTSSDVGKFYVGIVATMPLYTGAEITRQRTEEEGRRQSLSSSVSAYKDSIAGYRLYQRLVGLYAVLEQRSRTRIAAGVVSTTEQVSYLEKTAKAWEDQITKESDIEKHRLALLSRCSDKTKRAQLQELLDSYRQDEIK